MFCYSNAARSAAHTDMGSVKYTENGLLTGVVAKCKYTVQVLKGTVPK